MRRLFFFSAESEGFSFQEFPWLQHAGSVVPAPGLQSTGSVVVARGLSCSMASGIFLDQGYNPCLLHWQAGSLPGKSALTF